MTNYAVRYIDHENLVTAEQVARLQQILELPIDEALGLTADELDEDVTIGLDD